VSFGCTCETAGRGIASDNVACGGDSFQPLAGPVRVLADRASWRPQRGATLAFSPSAFFAIFAEASGSFSAASFGGESKSLFGKRWLFCTTGWAFLALDRSASVSRYSLGAIYGYPGTPERYRNRQFGARTPIPNLYLTGCDVLLPRIMGALMGGVLTAGALIGPFGFFRIMRAARSNASSSNV
jgi:hypothetical protein